MSSSVSSSFIGYGTHMSTPPSASTTRWNPSRLTYRTWWICIPLMLRIVRATRCGPPPFTPPSNAELILPSPIPGMSTHRSRGNERKTTSLRSGRVWTRMIVSERFSPPMCASVPNAISSSGVRPLRESLPSSR